MARSTQHNVRIVEHGTELPPPPPGVRHVSVPMIGIVISDHPLRTRVHRIFHWPMIVLALLVLPLLAIEYFFRIEHGSWTWWLWFIGMAVIWLAFVVEFTIKVAIAESRVEYVKRNWLDVIIIIMPALRPLRIASLAKTTRVFTLRGVAMKFARYAFTFVIGLEATERLLERVGVKIDPSRKAPEEMTRYQLIGEVKRLRALNDAWHRWHDDHREHMSANGVPEDHLPPPSTGRMGRDDRTRTPPSGDPMRDQ